MLFESKINFLNDLKMLFYLWNMWNQLKVCSRKSHIWKRSRLQYALAEHIQKGAKIQKRFFTQQRWKLTLRNKSNKRKIKILRRKKSWSVIRLDNTLTICVFSDFILQNLYIICTKFRQTKNCLGEGSYSEAFEDEQKSPIVENSVLILTFFTYFTYSLL